MFTLFFKKLFSVIIAGIMMMLFANKPGEAVKCETLRPDEVILDFTVLSDCHIESNNYDTYEVFVDLMRSVQNCPGNDATVFLGDNTMNGQNIENMIFFGTIDKIKPEGKTIVAPGNHDFSNGEGEYDVFRKRFADYSNAFLDYETGDVPYFYNIVNGCYFIVLSSEQKKPESMYMSDAQLLWLEETLEQAEKTDMPIFVFCHYPLYFIEDYYRLTDILSEYDNLFYFCGHTHVSLGYYTFYERDGVECINLPKSTEYIIYDTGLGARVEVYEDEVIIRIRNFCDNKWKEGYQRVYELD